MIIQAESDFEAQAKLKLNELLARVSFISLGASELAQDLGVHGQRRPDFVLPVEVGNEHWRLIGEIKMQAQPRQIRMAVLELKDYLNTLGDPRAYPVLLASYISPNSAEICRQAGVGCADLAGNCHLMFGNVFIERSGVSNPQVEKRGLRSVFSPKSARILRALLRDPDKAWKVADLAEATGTSLGQVSNVRKALLDQEWAKIESDGLRLVRPNAVLDAWSTAYTKRGSRRTGYYTPLLGDNLDGQIKVALADAGQGAHAVLAAFSAARWLAPFARYPSQMFYADEVGESVLREHLQLVPVSKGENVVIERLEDDGVIADRIEAAPGYWTTGLVQTFLDLTQFGERGIEASAHLRQTKIDSLWKGLA